MAVSAALMFLVARRYFRWGVAAFAVALVWFSSDVVLWQVMQARFYGLLLAGATACCAMAVQTEESQRALRGWELVLTFGAHLLLAGTHPFGVVYSAVVVAAMMVADRLARRWRPRLYLAAMAGWIVLLPSIAAIRSTAAVGRPYFWTTRPGPVALGQAYSCWSLACAVVLCGVALGLLLGVWRRWIGWETMRREAVAHRLVLLLGAGLLLVPLAVFCKSQWGQSLFVDRYLLPVVIGVFLVLCQMLAWLMEAAEQRGASAARALGGMGWGVVPVLVWVAGVSFPGYWRYPAVGEDTALLRALPKGIPVVVEPVNGFDQMESYHGREGYRFVWLLDWEDATAPDSPRGLVSGYHQMENWRKEGYFASSIQSAAEFLQTTPEFAVVEEPGLRWMERRVRGNPSFAVEPIRVPGEDGARVWLVRRRGAAAR